MRTTKLRRALLLAGVGALLTLLPAVAAAAAASTTAKFAARPIMAGVLPASSAFPTKCPPAAPVGKALGLGVTGPTVVMHVAGLALECKYTPAKGKLTLSWTKETPAAFASMEKTLGVRPGGVAQPVTGLGMGVSAYSNSSVQLAVQKGTLECTISYFGFKLVQMEALAKTILASYW
jgi:hypothetical protein